jgi:hypothetical protein
VNASIEADSGDALAAPVETQAASGPLDKATPPRPGLSPVLRDNVLLVLLFVAGVGGVFVLSLHKNPPLVDQDQKKVEAQVDAAILRLNAADASTIAGQSSQKVLQEFYNRSTTTQIPLKDLKKNPYVFVPPHPAGPIPPAESDKPAVDPEQKAREQSLEKANEAFRQMRLQSVMMGRGGATAIISNNLLTVGQQFQGFTVKSITARSVVLAWREREFVLSMQQ